MIEVQNLVKDFGENRAVDHVSFHVSKGEVLGFLGPNGAGKSTTMKMITGFLASSEGDVLIDGKSVKEHPLDTKSLIGYLPETSASYHDMTVRDFLEFIAEVRGYEGSNLINIVSDTVKKCYLVEVEHQTIDTLSKGYRQRVGFAQAILHDPPILILDEPTDGLDPNQKHEMRTLIREMGKTKCIILSTHILEEVDEVCSRVIVIAKGKVVADGSPDDLRKNSESYNRIHLSVHKAQELGVSEKLSALSNVEKVELISTNDNGLKEFYVYPSSKLNILSDVSKLAQSESWVLDSLSLDAVKLDTVFRQLTDKGDIQ
ncbi:MAG: ATP-binding cassette domain-containing protein [Candidatus Cloacimonetes bacterium]|nr:ATP-binding cassette domain-containing protein [Candidatus Cloacimonadota bacterium]